MPSFTKKFTSDYYARFEILCKLIFTFLFVQDLVSYLCGPIKWFMPAKLQMDFYRLSFR